MAFLKYLKKIDSGIAFLEKCTVVLLFAVLVLSIGANIAARNLFEESFQTVLEMAPVMVLWLACIGSTLALKAGRHIKLELALRNASYKTREIARFIVDCFGGVVMTILFFAAVLFVQNEISIFGGHGWLAIILPVFFGLAAFRFVLDMLITLVQLFDRAAISPDALND